MYANNLFLPIPESRFNLSVLIQKPLNTDLSMVKNICSKCGAEINEDDSEEDFKNRQLTELEKDIKCLEKGVQELERIAGLQKDKEQLCH